MGYFTVRYDSKVVIYDRKMFIRLATAVFMTNHKNIVGLKLTEFRIDQMAFGQPEHTCLNIQNVPLLQNHVDSVNPKFGQSGVYQKYAAHEWQYSTHDLL